MLKLRPKIRTRYNRYLQKYNLQRRVKELDMNLSTKVAKENNLEV